MRQLLKLLLPLWDFNAYPHAVGWEVGGGGGDVSRQWTPLLPAFKTLTSKGPPSANPEFALVAGTGHAFPCGYKCFIRGDTSGCSFRGSARTLRQRRTLMQKTSIRNTLWICRSLNEQQICEARASGRLIKSDLTTTWLQSNDKNLIRTSALNVNPGFGILSFAKV